MHGVGRGMAGRGRGRPRCQGMRGGTWEGIIPFPGEGKASPPAMQRNRTPPPRLCSWHPRWHLCPGREPGGNGQHTGRNLGRGGLSRGELLGLGVMVEACPPLQTYALPVPTGGDDRMPPFSSPPCLGEHLSSNDVLPTREVAGNPPSSPSHVSSLPPPLQDGHSSPISPPSFLRCEWESGVCVCCTLCNGLHGSLEKPHQSRPPSWRSTCG